MSEPAPHTPDDDGPDTYRNDPVGDTLAAHLFAGAAVAEANPDTDGLTDAPVESLCGRTRSYGPFTPAPLDLDAADVPLCSKCVLGKRSADQEGGP